MDFYATVLLNINDKFEWEMIGPFLSKEEARQFVVENIGDIGENGVTDILISDPTYPTNYE